MCYDTYSMPVDSSAMKVLPLSRIFFGRGQTFKILIFQEIELLSISFLSPKLIKISLKPSLKSFLDSKHHKNHKIMLASFKNCRTKKTSTKVILETSGHYPQKQIAQIDSKPIENQPFSAVSLKVSSIVSHGTSSSVYH